MKECSDATNDFDWKLMMEMLLFYLELMDRDFISNVRPCSIARQRSSDDGQSEQSGCVKCTLGIILVYCDTFDMYILLVS